MSAGNVFCNKDMMSVTFSIDSLFMLLLACCGLVVNMLSDPERQVTQTPRLLGLGLSIILPGSWIQLLPPERASQGMSLR